MDSGPPGSLGRTVKLKIGVKFLGLLNLLNTHKWNCPSHGTPFGTGRIYDTTQILKERIFETWKDNWIPIHLDTIKSDVHQIKISKSHSQQ